MPSSTIGVVGPEDGTDNISGVKSDEAHEFQGLEPTNNALAPAATVANGGQQELEFLGIAPPLVSHLDTKSISPRSKIRIFAVMGALFVKIGRAHV